MAIIKFAENFEEKNIILTKEIRMNKRKYINNRKTIDDYSATPIVYNDVNTLMGKMSNPDVDSFYERLLKCEKELEIHQFKLDSDISNRYSAQEKKYSSFTDVNEDPNTFNLFDEELTSTNKSFEEKERYSINDKELNDPINQTRINEQQFIDRSY